jgi:hypothetical protein
MLSAKYNSLMNPSALARALGRRGGLSRARLLSPAERARIASMGGRARRESRAAARRIADNFQYLAVVCELRPAPPVKRLRAFRGRLPGIYPPR